MRETTKIARTKVATEATFERTEVSVTEEEPKLRADHPLLAMARKAKADHAAGLTIKLP